MRIYWFCLLLLIVPFFTSSSLAQDIKITKLQEHLYLYRSFAYYKGNLVSANGLVVVSGDEVALLDTPWDKRQTRQLLDWVDGQLQKPVSFAVITHAHKDRIGGINVLKKQDIPTISSRLTVREAAKNGYARPDYSFASDTLLTFGTSSLEAYYPGPGHTVDNSVVYLRDQHILYGGCFIKSAAAGSLGNLEDAYVKKWSQSLEKIKERYPERKIVIPGHGPWTPGAIEQTLRLLSDPS